MSKFSDRIPIVYINRDEDIERRSYMESQFKNLGITHAVRFPAFTDDLIKADPGFRIEVDETRVSVFKAVVSHLLAIKSLDFKDSEYALILEDDVILTTSDYWDFTFDEFCNALPSSWDAVQLYLNPKYKYESPYLNLRPYRSTHISTVAYLLTKKRAEEIKNTWFRVGVPDVTKAYYQHPVFLTDDLIYTKSSYGVNLFSTETFVSTIVKKIPDAFHESSREILALWKASPLSLRHLLTDPYSKTSTL